MFESFLITFRETLEAGLVVFIILSYLKKVHQSRHTRVVYSGVVAALAVSAIAAFLFFVIAGGLQEPVEQIFEGTTMVLAAILITTMILWMARAHHVRHQIESHVAVELSDHHIFGLFAITFLAVLREGVETVLFLSAAIFRGSESIFLGSVLGIICAVLLLFLFAMRVHHLSLKMFFRVSSLLLIFFAAGLLAHGVHEFQEVGWLPFFAQEAWNINPPLLADGSYPLFHEKGVIGSILKGLFGYNGNPSILEVFVYIVYCFGAIFSYRSLAVQKEEAGFKKM